MPQDLKELLRLSRGNSLGTEMIANQIFAQDEE